MRKYASEDERILAARKAFEKRNHKATLIENGDRYTCIDWRREDGSGEYYINYIIDKKRGSLVISGDLGDCIATWYNPNSVHNIARYINSVEYFIGKIQCATDKYTYNDDDVVNDIDEDLSDCKVDRDEEFLEAWEDFQYTLPDNIFNEGFRPDAEAEEFLEKYLGENWWEYSSSWGRRISKRVFLWVAGLNMAVEQLDRDGLLTEAD